MLATQKIMFLIRILTNSFLAIQKRRRLRNCRWTLGGIGKDVSFRASVYMVQLLIEHLWFSELLDVQYLWFAEAGVLFVDGQLVFREYLQFWFLQIFIACGCDSLYVVLELHHLDVFHVWNPCWLGWRMTGYYCSGGQLIAVQPIHGWRSYRLRELWRHLAVLRLSLEGLVLSTRWYSIEIAMALEQEIRLDTRNMTCSLLLDSRNCCHRFVVIIYPTLTFIQFKLHILPDLCINLE